MDNMSKLTKKATELFETSERTQLITQCKEIAKYTLPSQEIIFGTDGNYYQGKQEDVADINTSLPIQLVRDLANALHTMLTNPSIKWLDVRFEDDEINILEASRAWLKENEGIVFKKISESNYHTEASKNYQSLIAFGNQALLQEEYDGDFLFTAVHLNNIAYKENYKKVIDTVAIRNLMWKEDILEKFEIAEESEIGRSLREGEQYKVIKYLYPRKKQDVSIDPITGVAPENKRPVACIYFLEHSNKILKETGFYENPVFVTRWDLLSGETYGRGIGHLAIAEIKKYNKVEELTLLGRETKIFPAFFLDADLDINLKEVEKISAGSIVRIPNLQSGSVQQYSSQADTQAQELTLERIERNLKSIFLIDKLALPPRDTVGEQSAYEVQQRLSQMQRFIGANMVRLIRENLQPLVKRSFATLFRAGKLTPLPDELKNRLGEDIKLDIRYNSTITRNLDLEKLENIRLFVSTIGELSQVMGDAKLMAEAIERLKLAGIIDEVARITQLDLKMMNTEEEMEENQEAMQQQMQQQDETAEMENMKTGSEAVKNMSQAEGGLSLPPTDISMGIEETEEEAV